MRGMAGIAAAAILLGTLPASAQVRRVVMTAPIGRVAQAPGRPVGFVRPAPPPVRVVDAPVRVISMAPQPPAGTTGGANVGTALLASTPVVASLGGTPIPLGQLLNPAPGLGFDFTHLAAINSDLGIRAIIDPITQQELALTEQLPQVQPTGYFPAYSGAPVVVAPAQPQILVVQQPVAQRALQEQAAPAAPAEAAAPPAPPLPPLGQILLVRRDGKVIRTVAFTEQGSHVVYIATDGRRRTVAVDQLDLKATEERNAEHGTFLHLTD